MFVRWFLVVTAGEFVGFSVPAIVGALTTEAPACAAFGAIVAAGAVEGTMLGLAQAAVLRQAVAKFPARRWVLATACAAVVAYVIGLSPSALADQWIGLPTVALAIVGLLLGAALLSSIGTAQWLVLRTFRRPSGNWIVVTAVVWLAGLSVFLAFAMPLWRPGQPVAVVAVIGAAGGLVMAAVTSAITGVAAQRLPC